MNLKRIEVTFLDIVEYQRKYLALKNTFNGSRDVRAADNSRESTLTRLVTISLWALERCQKANTKLHSRRLKPLWILSLLHNVLEADGQEAASNYERQIETGAGGAHYTVTEGSAEFGIGNHLVWASLCFMVRHWKQSSAAIHFMASGSLVPRARFSAVNKQASLLFGAGWPISPGHSLSDSITSVPYVSFDQQPNLLLIFLQTFPGQTAFWRALIIFFPNKSRRA